MGEVVYFQVWIFALGLVFDSLRAQSFTSEFDITLAFLEVAKNGARQQ